MPRVERLVVFFKKQHLKMLFCFKCYQNLWHVHIPEGDALLWFMCGLWIVNIFVKSENREKLNAFWSFDPLFPERKNSAKQTENKMVP